MIQLFDATFHSTAGELELMMRISDNITRGERRRAGSGNTLPPEIKEFFFLLSIVLYILFGFVMFISDILCFFSPRGFFFKFFISSVGKKNKKLYRRHFLK
jgi:hypothetical protein